MVWVRLGWLGRLHRWLSPRHTLFIPAERAAPIDDVFAARIASWDECQSRIEVDEHGRALQQTRRETAAGPADLTPEMRAGSERLAERWRSRRR